MCKDKLAQEWLVFPYCFQSIESHLTSLIQQGITEVSLPDSDYECFDVDGKVSPYFVDIRDILLRFERIKEDLVALEAELLKRT